MKAGDKLKCIKKDAWVSGRYGHILNGPKENEIVTFERVCDDHAHSAIWIDEYDETCFPERFFELVGANKT